MVVKHGLGQSLQGLSGVGIVCVGRDIPELAAYGWFANSNGILSSQGNPLLNQRGSLCSLPPSRLTGDLYVPFHLRRTFFPSLCFNLFCLFFFFLWPLDLARMDHVIIV